MNIKSLIVFVFAAFLSNQVLAEYYVVGSSCCGGTSYCDSCSYRPYYKNHSVKKHVKHVKYVKQYRHMQRNSYRVTVRYYYPEVSCGCRNAWVEGQCNCGRWVPGHWETKNYVTFSSRPAGGYSFGETYYTPSRDRATADDGCPDMQVN